MSEADRITQLSDSFKLKLQADGFPVADIQADLSRNGRPPEQILGNWIGLSRTNLSEGFFNEARDVLAPQVAEAIGQMLEPWKRNKASEVLPILQVKELARMTGLSAEKIIMLLNRYPVTLTINNQTLISEVQLPAFPNRRLTLNDAGDFRLSPQRVARAARYFSRPPGGGPAQKSGIQESRVDGIIKTNARKNALIVFAPVEELTLNEQTLNTPPQEITLEEDVKRAMGVLRKFNLSELGDLDPEIEEKVRKSLENEGCIEFIQFTCPRIDVTQLLSTQPENYFMTDPIGNNFSTTIPRLKKLISALKDAGITTRVNIVIGDLDEEEYMFPALRNVNLNSDIMQARRNEYAFALQAQLQEVMPCDFSVYQWSQINQYDANTQLRISTSYPDIQGEMIRMKQLFEPGNYYAGLTCPSDEVLEEIVKLKFIAYAKQGYTLGTLFENSILLQSELPPRLRTSMLNGASENTGVKLRALYPYGRSDSPY